MAEKAKETFYCSFVSIHYIICECGETFPSEEALKEHLEKEHNTKNDAKEIQPKNESKPTNIICKSEPSVSEPKRKEPKKIYIKKLNSQQLQNFILIKQDQSDTETIEVEVKTENDEGKELKQEIKYEEQEVAVEYPYLEGQVEEYEDQEQNEETYEEQDAELEDHDAVVSILENHLQEEHRYNATPQLAMQDDLFYCEVCGRGFSSQKNVTTHIKRTHLKQRLQQTEKQLTEKPTEERRQKTQYCNQCEKTFFSQKGLNLHTMRIHSTDVERQAAAEMKRKVVCEVCGRKYASNAALRYHQRVHTGEKPYQCTICFRRFTMPLFLQIHTRTHTGERPYGCPHCPKAFSNKAALLRHDRVHTGVRPYTCPECNKAFTQSNSMKLHIRTVHLKLPTPYKSKARRLKALLRAGGSVESQQIKLYAVDSTKANDSQLTYQKLEYHSDEDNQMYTEEYEDTESQQ